MFRKGDELLDERFGERYVLLETAEETGGASVRIEDAARPGPSRRTASVHPHQEERFEVVSGTLGLTVDGQERLLGPGQSFVVSPGTRHLPRNAGEDELRFVAEIRPAGRFEKFLAEITAANNSGRGGLAYLLAAAQVLHRFPDVERPTPLPRPVERALFAVLAGAGRLIFHVFGALAEFERETIRERTMAGLESARARGVTAGGPGRSTRAKPGWRGVSKTRASNSVEEICSMPGVGRCTLHRYLGEGDVERSERG